MTNRPRRFIDSNIFVYVLARDPQHASRALAVLEDAENHVYEAYTSTLVLSQVLGYLERRRKWKAVTTLLEYLDEAPITVIETRYEDFTRARQIAAQYNLDYPRLWDDLIITAQMQRSNIVEIYSNDSDFDKIPLVKRLF